MILIIKPLGRGNWRTSEIRCSCSFSAGEIIYVNRRLYRIVSIRQTESA